MDLFSGDTLALLHLSVLLFVVLPLHSGYRLPSPCSFGNHYHPGQKRKVLLPQKAEQMFPGALIEFVWTLIELADCVDWFTPKSGHGVIPPRLTQSREGAPKKH